MRTITFYSYKGGVGRSLLVANTAKYLSTLGKSVFAMDLDLDAPGLHYKFELGADAVRSEAARGIVDILSGFLKSGALPKSLADYTTNLNVASDAGSIQIMRAGTAPDSDYWRSLSQINWYDFLYGQEPVGVPFFLELKEHIRSSFKPDFLLIDARTGITEMGGIATTVLPDTVVCLGLGSIEHLEGLRAVMRGIARTTSKEDVPVNLLSVISRLSWRGDESAELARIREFLNTPIREGVPGLDLDEVFALHAEPLLDLGEQLLVGGTNSPHELLLLRDYLRLFAKIIPAEDIRPHVGQLIAKSVARLLDDPDGAQSDLEALTTYCADQEAYRALLKLYQVRKAPIEKILATASLMWQLGGSKTEPDALHLDIVAQAFSDQRPTEAQKRYAEFGESVWRATGMANSKIGLTIVNAYLPERKDRALRILNDYVDKSESPDYAAVTKLVELLGSLSLLRQAFSIIDRFKAKSKSPQFFVVWGKLVLDQKDQDLALHLLEDEYFSFAAVSAADPATAYRLMKSAGDESASKFLTQSLESAAVAGEVIQLRSLGELYQEEGRWNEFESLLGKWVPAHALAEISDSVRRRFRRSRGSGRFE